MISSARRDEIVDILEKAERSTGRELSKKQVHPWSALA